MMRAALTIFAAFMVTLTLGTVMVIVGSIYPLRWVGRFCTFTWGRVVLAAAGVRLTVRGREHISTTRTQFFAGNHQSALDIPILLTVLRGNVRFLAKDSLFRIPIFGRAMRNFGYISIDRSNPRKALANITASMHRGTLSEVHMAVFPEGTRSGDGRLLPFRAGTIKIGQRAGLPVVPFTIDGSMRAAHRNEFKVTPGPVTLTFHPPIDAVTAAGLSAHEINKRLLAAVASGFPSSGQVGGAPSGGAPSSAREPLVATAERLQA